MTIHGSGRPLRLVRGLWRGLECSVARLALTVHGFVRPLRLVRGPAAVVAPGPTVCRSKRAAVPQSSEEDGPFGHSDVLAPNLATVVAPGPAKNPRKRPTPSPPTSAESYWCAGQLHVLQSPDGCLEMQLRLALSKQLPLVDCETHASWLPGACDLS